MAELFKLATFSSEFEAEAAQATLAAGGIDSYLQIDDAGGMLPVLQQNQGIGLFVDEEDAGEAQSLLSDNAAAPAEGEASPSEPPAE